MKERRTQSWGGERGLPSITSCVDHSKEKKKGEKKNQDNLFNG